MEDKQKEYIALYRKYRPSVFSDVYGQEHVTRVLQSEVMGGKVSHAYLFCGSRGTGKTTCAKILAKAVNCENPQNGDPCGVCPSCIASLNSFDITEIDAASNNGVDNIRELREDIIYPPGELKKRVYIIDEVHMLSIGAFNALLKTLEEPPSHALFILATTEANKLPATILSRCKRFDFNRIPPDTIAKALKVITEKENINLTYDALMLIATLAAGAMRDALSMLELFGRNEEEKNAEQAAEILGVMGKGPCIELVRSIGKGDTANALETIREVYNKSKDMGVLCDELNSVFRDLLVVKYTKQPEKYIEDDLQTIEALKQVSEFFTKEKIIYCTEITDKARISLSANTFSARIILETAVMKMCDMRLVTSLEALNARMAQLEEKLKNSGDYRDSKSVSVTSEKLKKHPEKENLQNGAVKEENQEKYEEKENEKDNSADFADITDTAQESQDGISDISCYGEFVEAVKQKDGMIAGFLNDGYAKLLGDTAVIFAGPMAILMADNDEKKALFGSCLSEILKKDVKVILKNKELVKNKGKISLEDLK